MSLPNLSGRSENASDFAGIPIEAELEPASVATEFRDVPDFEGESGLDGFTSEDNEPDMSGSTRAWGQPGDGSHGAPIGRSTAAPAAAPRPRTNVLSMASRAISQARDSMAGASSRARIATFVPRLVQNARLDRLVSTASFVGQTSARVTQSLSTTLTKPRWRFDARLAVPLALAIIGFTELWWVSHRLSNPAVSLAENATAVAVPPVVTESSDNVVSLDRKGGDALRMRVTFRSVTPAGPNVDRKAPTWVAVSAPMPVEITERGQQIGTSWSGGMKLTPGPHDLRIVNRSMGIDVQKSVEIAGGGMASLSLDFPPGTLQITATPWANVDMDGVAIGKTPLDQIELAPGRHDVVFTHPRFGQRRTSVTIKSGKPQRVNVDLRRRGR
jgi:PEGA domain